MCFGHIDRHRLGGLVPQSMFAGGQILLLQLGRRYSSTTPGHDSHATASSTCTFDQWRYHPPSRFLSVVQLGLRRLHNSQVRLSRGRFESPEKGLDDVDAGATDGLFGGKWAAFPGVFLGSTPPVDLNDGLFVTHAVVADANSDSTTDDHGGQTQRQPRHVRRHWRRHRHWFDLPVGDNDVTSSRRGLSPWGHERRPSVSLEAVKSKETNENAYTNHAVERRGGCHI